MSDAIRTLAAIQAIYFTVTGVWPILHMESFLWVTGPKRDLWLVKTVGVMIISVGLTLGCAAWRGEVSFSIAMLAIASSAGLTAVDVVYSLKRTISRIYLLDAVLEIILIAAWLLMFKVAVMP